jgi:hypothetical protein
MRPKGIKETKPRKRKDIIPGLAALKRLWTGGHYKDRGLSFDDFVSFSKQNCFYCGDEPRLTNPFGMTWEHYLDMNHKPSSKGWWEDQFIYVNGVDKITPSDRYDDTSNLVPCCKTCNWLKGLLGQEDFIRQCNKIAKNHPRIGN